MSDATSFFGRRGCRFAYNLVGSGPPVVFIQGCGVAGSGWLPQIEALASRYRCLFFDNRGMGASQPVGTPLTVEQMANDTLALMDQVGFDSAHVVGHSLGGLVAQHLALTARKRVLSLALLCTFSRGRDATQLSWGMFWLGLRTYVGTRGMRRRAFAEMVLPPQLYAERDAWAERLAPLFGHDLADQPPVVMKQLVAMNAYDATSHLGQLAGLPTLVVGAKYDRIARIEVVRQLAANLPGSRLVEFEDAAHGVTIQKAPEINKLLEELWPRADGVANQQGNRGDEPRG